VTGQLVDEWRHRRQVLIERSVGKFEPNDVTYRLSEAFRRLQPDERVQLEPLLREWLLSDDFADRFDAIAIARDNDVTSMIPTLRELQARLEGATDIAQIQEWKKVNRALGHLVSVAERESHDG
jgi:hypothetical protein